LVPPIIPLLQIHRTAPRFWSGAPGRSLPMRSVLFPLTNQLQQLPTINGDLRNYGGLA